MSRWIRVYRGGLRKRVLRAFAFIGGQRKTVTKGFVYIGGQRKQFFPDAPPVTTITQTFTTPGAGSTVIPANVDSMRITLNGGGGGGGGRSLTAPLPGSGAGGGGGASAGRIVAALYNDAGKTINFTIGAGGTAGTESPSTAGSSGGASTVDWNISAGGAYNMTVQGATGGLYGGHPSQGGGTSGGAGSVSGTFTSQVFGTNGGNGVTSTGGIGGQSGVQQMGYATQAGHGGDGGGYTPDVPVASPGQPGFLEIVYQINNSPPAAPAVTMPATISVNTSASSRARFTFRKIGTWNADNIWLLAGVPATDIQVRMTKISGDTVSGSPTGSFSNMTTDREWYIEDGITSYKFEIRNASTLAILSTTTVNLTSAG